MDPQGVKQVTITARCLCSARVYKTSVQTSALPLRAVCCHCDSCRRMTGGLYFAVTPWPPCGDDASSNDGRVGVDLSQLKRYDFSATIAVFSCPICSSFLFCRGPGREDPLCVVVGSLDDTASVASHKVLAVVYEAHIFVGDTLDGGVSRLLCRNGDGDGAVVASRWRGRNNGASEDLGAGWPASEGWMRRAAPETKGPSSATTARLRCVCGGVDFVLRRSRVVGPDGASDDAELDAVEPGTARYRAGFCACDSCRLFFGADVTACAWVPLSHLGFVGTGEDEGAGAGDTFPRDLAALRAAVDDGDDRLGTLRCYARSLGCGFAG